MTSESGIEHDFIPGPLEQWNFPPSVIAISKHKELQSFSRGEKKVCSFNVLPFIACS